ncbi:putative iron-sulfur cluster-binding metallochaperone [Deinococcus marmoris]|uniref:putative iron-sulfur cluster-binding metallochaperone n=1 Tax=Deinococcus marmoris TaxID=249408 RepID=UPI0004970808|nr:copper chaperone Copz family protein [Deinococcus marmoris]
MELNCCASSAPGQDVTSCPVSGTRGKAVPLITLKALLTPLALARLTPEDTFRFCPDPTCDVVYFNAAQICRTEDLKVLVFQKDQAPGVPVCYCFGHTRADLSAAAASGTGQALETSIRAHIQAGRCGCEVNNPQGRCCLGNVVALLRTLDRQEQA